MNTEVPAGCRRLVSALDAAVGAHRDPVAVTGAVERALCRLIAADEVSLPAALRRPTPTSYARRLICHNPALDYTAIAMVWGPGQGTPVHDHNGLWCVEGVLSGRLEIVRYDLRERDGVRYRFMRGEPIAAGVGSAGRLIPPIDYHTIVNPSRDEVAITIHVYGGEMDRCAAFQPLADGWYQREERALRYTAA